MSTADPANRRVLLKLSGEVFGGGRVGLDPDVVSGVAQEVAVAAMEGVQIAIVVGGGNFFRGAELSQRGLDRARADYMGMLGTVMNALDRKSTRLNSSHVAISYAVFCLKKRRTTRKKQ